MCWNFWKWNPASTAAIWKVLKTYLNTIFHWEHYKIGLKSSFSSVLLDFQYLDWFQSVTFLEILAHMVTQSVRLNSWEFCMTESSFHLVSLSLRTWSPIFRHSWTGACSQWTYLCWSRHWSCKKTAENFNSNSHALCSTWKVGSKCVFKLFSKASVEAVFQFENPQHFVKMEPFSNFYK